MHRDAELGRRGDGLGLLGLLVIGGGATGLRCSSSVAAAAVSIWAAGIARLVRTVTTSSRTCGAAVR